MTDFFANMLEGINSIVHNYGWSMILFTLLIRIIVVPFDYKSRVAMRKTTKIQPELNKLQKKYADDQQKLNQKMTELYKREGISPMSSCLPILISMPILFIMFGAMRQVANTQVVNQVLDVLAGKEPVMESWYWIKNLWAADSPFVSQLPNLSVMQAVPSDLWQKLVTGETLQQLTESLGLVAEPFSSANLTATLNTLWSAMQQSPVYANTGVLGGWTFSFLGFFSMSIMKDWNGLFILPLLAAGSQLLMTKITSAQQPQPQQQEGAAGADTMKFMNWFFPIFSIWICSSSNASFSLYWVAANIIATVENLIINRIVDAKEAKAAQAALGEGNVK